MNVVVIMNQSAGTFAKSDGGDEPTRVRESFRRHGMHAEVKLVQGAKLSDAAAEAKDGAADAVVGAGGDGTLNAVAGPLVGSGKPFGVLPLGTHNHFAKDLNVPLELDRAVAVVAEGEPRDIDVARVNGRLFLNFSAIGFHPRLVKHRDAQRDARGRRKFFAMFIAMFSVMRRPPVLRVRLRAPGRSMDVRTPSVIVCNNEHQMRVFGVEKAAPPDRGSLNVYVAKSTGRFGLIRLLFRALLRRLDNAKDFECLTLSEFRIDSPAPLLRVSLDGEVLDLETPLHYKLLRGGLKVIMAKRSPEF